MSLTHAMKPGRLIVFLESNERCNGYLGLNNTFAVVQEHETSEWARSKMFEC